MKLLKNRERERKDGEKRGEDGESRERERRLQRTTCGSNNCTFHGVCAGNFGCVKRGFLTLPEQKGDILVAIKTLHGERWSSFSSTCVFLCVGDGGVNFVSFCLQSKF